MVSHLLNRVMNYVVFRLHVTLYTVHSDFITHIITGFIILLYMYVGKGLDYTL